MVELWPIFLVLAAGAAGGWALRPRWRHAGKRPGPFSEAAAQACWRAGEVAKQRDGPWRLTAAHLAVALMSSQGFAGAYFRECGLNLKRIEEKLLALPADASDATHRLTASFDLANKRATQESYAWGHGYVGTEHFLIALCGMKDLQDVLGIGVADVRAAWDRPALVAARRREMTDTVGALEKLDALARGQALLRFGYPAEAMAALREAPGGPETRRARGQAHLMLGEWSEAIAELEPTITVPTSGQSLFVLGHACFCAGEIGRARELLDEALMQPAPPVNAYYDRGMIAFCRQQHDRALQDFEAFVTQRRTVTMSTYAILRTIVAARMLKDKAAEERWLAQGLKACDADVWPFPLLQMLRGDLDAAAALSLAEGHPARIGEAYTLLGDMQSAPEHFETALKTLPPSGYERTICRSRLGLVLL